MLSFFVIILVIFLLGKHYFYQLIIMKNLRTKCWNDTKFNGDFLSISWFNGIILSNDLTTFIYLNLNFKKWIQIVKITQPFQFFHKKSLTVKGG